MSHPPENIDHRILSPEVKSALDVLFDGVYITDKTRRIIFWNKGAEAITGYAAAEVQGHRCSENILNHIDENGKPLCLSACPLLRCILTGQNVTAKIYPLVKSGGRIPVETHISPLRNEQGEIVGGIEVFRDISRAEDYRILQEKFHQVIKKYVSDSAYGDILKQAVSSTKSNSQLRELTLLYMDVVGFTPFSETHSHEEVIEMLNIVFGVCSAVVSKNSGEINKFIGDAVLAVFASPQDAVNAGIEIISTLKTSGKVRLSEGHARVQVRIGINSGRVIQGDVGPEDRKDITVLGDAVNIAARLQSIAAPDSICISENTWSRIKNRDLFNFSGKELLKGKQEQVSVYKLKDGIIK